MNSFLFSIDALSNPLRDTIMNAYDLDPNGLHFITFDTNEVNEPNEFEEYVNKHGFPEDVKICVYANCYPSKLYNPEDETNNIKTICF